MNILEHPLVLKYFKCDTVNGKDHLYSCEEHLARSVIQSMQQPIKKGEKYLALEFDHSVYECDEKTFPEDTLHPFFLRLPDRFQEKKECCPWKDGTWRLNMKAGAYVAICQPCLESLHKKSWEKPEPENLL